MIKLHRSQQQQAKRQNKCQIKHLFKQLLLLAGLSQLKLLALRNVVMDQVTKNDKVLTY